MIPDSSEISYDVKINEKEERYLEKRRAWLLKSEGDHTEALRKDLKLLVGANPDYFDIPEGLLEGSMWILTGNMDKWVERLRNLNSAGREVNNDFWPVSENVRDFILKRTEGDLENKTIAKDMTMVLLIELFQFPPPTFKMGRVQFGFLLAFSYPFFLLLSNNPIGVKIYGVLFGLIIISDLVRWSISFGKKIINKVYDLLE